jgi:hypothetical protein
MFNNKAEIDALHFRIAQLEDTVNELDKRMLGFVTQEDTSLLLQTRVPWSRLYEGEQNTNKTISFILDAICMEFQTEAATPSKTVLVKKTEENV